MIPLQAAWNLQTWIFTHGRVSDLGRLNFDGVTPHLERANDRLKTVVET